jgi:hypothetical protein
MYVCTTLRFCNYVAVLSRILLRETFLSKVLPHPFVVRVMRVAVGSVSVFVTLTHLNRTDI